MTRPLRTAGYDIHGAFELIPFPCASKTLPSLDIAPDDDAGCSSRILLPMLLVLPFCDRIRDGDNNKEMAASPPKPPRSHFFEKGRHISSRGKMTDRKGPSSLTVDVARPTDSAIDKFAEESSKQCSDGMSEMDRADFEIVCGCSSGVSADLWKLARKSRELLVFRDCASSSTGSPSRKRASIVVASASLLERKASTIVVRSLAMLALRWACTLNLSALETPWTTSYSQGTSSPSHREHDGLIASHLIVSLWQANRQDLIPWLSLPCTECTQLQQTYEMVCSLCEGNFEAARPKKTLLAASGRTTLSNVEVDKVVSDRVGGRGRSESKGLSELIGSPEQRSSPTVKDQDHARHDP